MTPASRALADAYWARDLGRQPGELRPTAPRVQAHAGGLAGYAGVFVFVAEGAPVVSAPPALAPRLVSRAQAFTPAAVSDPQALAELLKPAEITSVIGPAMLSYADRTSLAPLETRTTRLLTDRDRPAFEALRAACPPDEWDPKSFDLDARPTFGSFDAGGQLVAVADYEIWDGTLAHLSVVSHPGARRRGHGVRVVAAAARAALDAGLVLQYRALHWNQPSLAIASKLGFQRYGWTVAARLAGSA